MSVARNTKNLSLGLLVLQNTSLVLLMRHSLTVRGPRYMPSTAVALMEMVKLVVCLVVVYMESGEKRTFLRKLDVEVVQKRRELGKLAVPALLYTLQNNMLYTALANLDAATYSVCYQTKIITTGVFSVFLLGKKLTCSKWGALVLLTVGVALAELSNLSTKPKKDESLSDHVQSPVLGFTFVMAAACTSGFAGVYFEMILKGSTTSLWIRNIQMGVPSIILSLLSVLAKDWSDVREKGFFYGYNAVVVGVVLLQAIGGLVVAVVVKYADNIRKSFATAVSIVVSCILSMALFNFQPNWAFVLGVICVCGSVFWYSRAPSVQGLPVYSQGSALDRQRDVARRV